MKPNMKPKAFIGSSTENLKIAQSLQQQLGDVTTAVVWNQGVFGLSDYILEDLIKATKEYDFGIFVFGADDTVKIRNRRYLVVRDNVVFELGLFIGRLGIKRNYLVVQRTSEKLHLPSDLDGLIVANFELPDSTGTEQVTRQQINIALAIASNQIRASIEDMGAKKDEEIGDDTNTIKTRLGEGIATFFENQDEFFASGRSTVFGEAKDIVRRLQTDSDVYVKIRAEIEERKVKDNNWTFANILTEALALVNALGLSNSTPQENEIFLTLNLPSRKK